MNRVKNNWKSIKIFKLLSHKWIHWRNWSIKYSHTHSFALFWVDTLTFMWVYCAVQIPFTLTTVIHFSVRIIDKFNANVSTNLKPVFCLMVSFSSKHPLHVLSPFLRLFINTNCYQEMITCFFIKFPFWTRKLQKWQISCLCLCFNLCMHSGCLDSLSNKNRSLIRTAVNLLSFDSMKMQFQYDWSCINDQVKIDLSINESQWYDGMKICIELKVCWIV